MQILIVMAGLCIVVPADIPARMGRALDAQMNAVLLLHTCAEQELMLRNLKTAEI